MNTLTREDGEENFCEILSPGYDKIHTSHLWSLVQDIHKIKSNFNMKQREAQSISSGKLLAVDVC